MFFKNKDLIMYIGYVYDRKNMGFSCTEDDRAAKQVLNLVLFIKKKKGVSVAYIVKKGKQIFLLLFSKEILIGVVIFVKSISVKIDPDVYRPLSSSSKVYQCRIINSNHLKLKKKFRINKKFFYETIFKSCIKRW